MAQGDAGPRKRRRLSRSGEFNRAYREGSSKANRHLVLYRFPRGEDESPEARLGVSVSRKVGGAVERNRVKRALREAFWSIDDTAIDAYDFVIVARSGIGALIDDQGTDGVRECIKEVLISGSKGERST